MKRFSNPYTLKPTHITRTPGVMGGQPCIEGRRITTRQVWRMRHHGYSYQYIWENFDLPKWEQDAAVAYENRLHRRIGRRIEAAKRSLCVRWGYCDE